jgi:hypothetical protein
MDKSRVKELQSDILDALKGSEFTEEEYEHIADEEVFRDKLNDIYNVSTFEYTDLYEQALSDIKNQLHYFNFRG